MTRDRKRLIAGAAGIAAIGVAGIIPAATPAQAEPDIDDVRKKVDKLYTQAEAANEDYSNAKLRLQDLKDQLEDLNADEKRQSKELDKIRAELRDSVLRQFEGSDVSAVGQVITSEDPQEFLAGLATVSSYNALQADLLARYNTEAEALQVRREATEDAKAQMAKVKTTMQQKKSEIDKKFEAAQSELDELEADELAKIQSTDTSIPSNLPPPSGRAKAAVDYALAQVGDSYVYGATGTESWDCSGLTMGAWGQAGVSLPHSSSAQYSSGPQVSRDQLAPGDLVFYYSPISHVGMYIGNGQIVHAANPSTGVKVSPIDEMPYTGAVRPG
ncbi:putative NPL/P60 family secreted protein [Nocardioidaceae bacterium Broad-1]|uniref:C40 family peptidase n=1 Tax=Nocardioides luteus TaxID=1844 RepID=UPI0002029597|nr:C40 family peptidase [Nocardioides luteus]EGD40760.1 putative NPL/P60 family secreted protein [Nocardioidaceae bacterium Broad-1]MBG6097400.1 cell wall-associated NlpC family hydrolase/outer membrane murein-binding lipoprotein Lpp [Nocardioides luteus]